MDAGYNPRTVEEVFRDYKGRRAGLTRALTTDVEDFFRQCDPEKENLCLYGFPNEHWEVNLPAEEVPPELPEPALGINFARDGMQEKDWLSMVAVHSDAWLLSVAFYFGARFGFDKNDRKRLFGMINELPTVFDVVSGKNKTKTPSNNNHSNSKSKSHNKMKTSEPRAKQPKPQMKDEDREDDAPDAGEDGGAVAGGGGEEHGETFCGACGENYGQDEFWIGCYTALTVRKIVKTELVAAEPMGKPSAFATLEFWAWGAVFVASFATAFVNPTALGTTARTCLPFMLASTVLGYMVGSGLPAGIKKLLHPIICCALSANFAAVAYGYLSGSGIDAALGDYLTKVPSDPGAGDVLMGFLGSVIISFAFSMFKQRKLVKRHAAEIFTSIAVASTFSLYSTAILGRLIGLEPTLTISILPRCITVALALSIVSFFEGANTSVTAAVVVLTGLIGANFVQAAMDKLGLNDPIARGIGTASSAHGLGTAALSAKEPEALPFCAIAYALTGIFGSLICSSAAVRQSLVFIAG